MSSKIKTIPMTQEYTVLQVLKKAKGKWVNKQFFLHDLMFSQAGRAIFVLENNKFWRDQYKGYRIEHSEFRDEFGFKSYRLKKIK